MGLFDWLRGLLAALFGPVPSEPDEPDEPNEPDRPDEPDDPAYPTEWTKTAFDAPEVHVGLYSSRALVDANGRAPEVVAGRYLANALEHAGLNYRIGRGFEPVDVGFEGKKETLRLWRRADREWTAKDANVLLTDQVGGGLAAVGGKFGYAPGGRIDRVVDWEAMSDSQLHRNVHAVLHEVGHMLGAKHDHDSEEEGRQHPGMGWNEAGYWHRTPTVAGNGYPNLCDEPIEAKAHEAVMRHQLYHDCFRQHLRIAPDGEGDPIPA